MTDFPLIVVTFSLDREFLGRKKARLVRDINPLAQYSEEIRTYLTILSPGQTDRQVAANGRKLNLRGDLRWVTWPNGAASRPKFSTCRTCDSVCPGL